MSNDWLAAIPQISNGRGTVYRPEIGNDRRLHPSGPGNGFGYYSGTMYSMWRFDPEKDQELVRIICAMLDEAFWSGWRMQGDLVRKALGVQK